MVSKFISECLSYESRSEALFMMHKKQEKNYKKRQTSRIVKSTTEKDETGAELKVVPPPIAGTLAEPWRGLLHESESQEEHDALYMLPKASQLIVKQPALNTF